MVQERVAAESARMNAVLHKLGAPSLDGVDTWLQERDEQHARELAEKGRFEELYASERKARAELQAQMEQARKDAAERESTAAIERALMEAAARSVSPQQTSALLRNRVRYDEATRSVYAVDDHGHRITDGKGNYLGVNDLVDQFLTEHPHFAPAAPGRGGAGSANAAPDTVTSHSSTRLDGPVDKAKLGDSAYRAKVLEAVRQSLRGN